ncbi:MAG: hypothetical protein VKP63_09125, partial [Cyanobacteriota bacterium]|nr:hypothetical protein [Cyanobacteriota bacterium]
MLPALYGQEIKIISPRDDRGELNFFYHNDYELIDVEPGRTIWLSLEANFNGWLEVFDRASGQLVAWDDDSGLGTNSLLGFLPLSGVTYRVRAGSHGGIGSGYYSLKTLALADAAREWESAAREPWTGPSLMPLIREQSVSTPITISLV